LEQGKLDAMAIAVAAHPPRLLLPALPAILLLVLDFTAQARQSFCLQRAGALVEDATEKLQIMELAEVILRLPEFSDPSLEDWIAPMLEVLKGIAGPFDPFT
jgi:hypothetical protein